MNIELSLCVPKSNGPVCNQLCIALMEFFHLCELCHRLKSMENLCHSPV